MQKNHFEIK